MVHIRNGNDLRTAYGILHIRHTSLLRKRKRPDVRIILVDAQGGHIHAGTGWSAGREGCGLAAMLLMMYSKFH